MSNKDKLLEQQKELGEEVINLREKLLKEGSGQLRSTKQESG